jgi:hypothetical protein
MEGSSDESDEDDNDLYNREAAFTISSGRQPILQFADM